MRWAWLGLLLLAGCAHSPHGSPAEGNPPASPPVPPSAEGVPPLAPGALPEAQQDRFVFRLRGLTPDLISAAKSHPSYQVEELPDGGVQVSWDPKVPKDWEALRERYGGKHYPDFLYDLIAIKAKLGKTQFTHGGLGTDGWGGSAFREARHWLNAAINFDNLATGNNDIMFIHGVLGPTSKEVQHEMLRDFPGTKVSIEKCGEGYVIISRASRGVMVVWQINDQTYALIGDTYDKEMVAAYVNRLGSVVPKDFKVEVDPWVKDEILYRTHQVDHYFRTQGWGDRNLVCALWSNIASTFPEVYKTKGSLSADRKLAWNENHAHFLWVRHWLWANKDNFQYNDETRGFLLKGPDRYDPQHPPELPEEMRHLPRPPEVSTP